MDGACAFFMPILLVLFPQDLEMKVLTINPNKEQFKNNENYETHQTNIQSHPYPRRDAHDGADGLGGNGDENCDVVLGRWLVW
ncbi:MAG: hypothetical protein J6W19_04550 [Prevotella sp.]|nr:hypothetical protein [Prevotella sp.]